MDCPGVKALPFLSYHESQTKTIVLIHGAFSSCHEFAAIIPRLSRYHLLVPGHTAATMVPKFELSKLIHSIAALINDQAKGSRAHLVGLSFGGHLALRVAGQYPDMVQSVFVSGVNRLPSPSAGPTWSTVLLPFLVWGSENFGRLIPSKILNYAMGGRLCEVDGAVPPTIQQVKNLLGAISTDEPFLVLQARVLLLAATQSCWPEEPDNVLDARAVFEEIQPVGIEGSRCVAHSGLTHSWMRGHPELFSATVMAVIEELPANDGFSDINVNRNSMGDEFLATKDFLLF